MKTGFKRVQLIYRTTDGEYTKVWQNIDSRKMITLEHVWKDINQQLTCSPSNSKCLFYFYKTKQVLPVWYHVDLLNDNDQILIERYFKMTIRLYPQQLHNRSFLFCFFLTYYYVCPIF
jgi:hypothetical protein